MSDGVHDPLRPSWLCDTCGEPWPCKSAKLYILNPYMATSISISLLVWDRFEQAAEDMPDTPAADLYDRMILWTRTWRMRNSIRPEEQPAD